MTFYSPASLSSSYGRRSRDGAEMAVAGIATSLMFGIAQIIEGDATCSACDRPAVVTTWNGADPDAEPMCLDHALMMLDMTRSVAVNIFGTTSDDE